MSATAGCSMTDPARSDTRASGRRVLWLPYAQHGAVNPVVPAVLEIQARGAHVLLLGPPGLRPLADLLGVRFEPYSTASLFYDWSTPDGRDAHGLGPAARAGWFAERVAGEMAETVRVFDSFAPDVCLIDSFLIGSGLAAESHRIPWGSYVHYLFDEGADVDAMHQVWWEDRSAALSAYLRWWNELRAAVGLPAENRAVADAPWYRMSPLATFLLGHPGLRRGRRPLPAYVSRTSFPPWDCGESTGRRLRSPGRPAVLLANSSAWQEDTDLIGAAFEALGDMDLDVITTVSAVHELRTAVPPNVHLCGFVPHSQLLPEVDAVVTTGGYGLVSKALWWGLPAVVAPLGRDQPYVAEAVEGAGCGIRVAWPPRPPAIADAVRTALASPDLRERARRMAGPTPGHPGPADVADQVLALGGRS